MPGGLDDQPRAPEVGGVLDLFLPIYWALAQPSRLHPQMTEEEVDACSIPMIATYLGVVPDNPDDPFGSLTGDLAADAARLNRRRLAEAANT